MSDAADEEFSLTEEQEDALALDHNVAITAGAGTGKTTTLTERYVHVLEEESDVGPEEVVTITFTNDAANELQERIRDEVDEKLHTTSDADYERWRTVKDDLEDGYVHTIHGFCARLLREEVVDAPVTPEFEVYDETDAAVLAREVVRRTIQDHLDGGPLQQDVERLAHLWSRSTVEDVLVGLLQQRPGSETWAETWSEADPDDYLDFVWETVHPISPDFARDVLANEDVRSAFESISRLYDDGLLGDVAPMDDDGADTVREVTRLLDEYAALSSDAEVRSRQRFLDELCDYLTTNDGERDGRDWTYWGSSGRWSDAGREAEQQDLETAVETIFTVVDPPALEFGVEADRASAHYVLALARVLADALDAYRETKEDRNVLDYDDLVETTIEFLETHPDIRERRRDQFAYVMVDEVQDTDPRQWELVRLLTSGDPEDFDARNVFLVGDEKQSIYRFRGADVRSFADARVALADANPPDADTDLELSGNFRTVDETLSFCNDLFDRERVFAPFDGTHAPFESRPQLLTAEREEGRDLTGHCEYLLVPDDDHAELHGDGYLDETPRFVESGEREAYAIATRLTRLFADPPDVYDEDGGEPREAVPEDVTILLRSRTRLKAYERALDAYDVPYTVVGGTGYYDAPEIAALLNLLRVLENPRNEIALYGVLRSPIFGVADDDLARLRVDHDDLWDALADADGELADAYELLTDWRELAGTHPNVSAENTTPWGTLVTRVIEDTGFLAAVAGDERPRQAAVNVNRFREQLRRREEGGVKTVSDLRTQLERRQELEAHAGEATIPEDADGVQLRTIHSAKGLEFPIVAVPELGTQFNFQADVDEHGKVYFDEIDVDGSGEREPILGIKSPTPDDAFAEEDTLVRRVTRSRVERHERAELKRLLYVAATRARDHLFLSGVHEVESAEDGYDLCESNDHDEANCWRDWVQPALLEGGSVLEDLVASGRANPDLDDSSYVVSRPVPPAPEWDETSCATDVSLSIDIPEPESQRRPLELTATDYASLVSGTDDVYLEQEGAEPDAEYGSTDGFHATTLGTVVHRICEAGLAREEWRSVARNVGEQQNATPTDDDLERIETYAARALAFLEDYESALDVQGRRDELSVVARFDHARIVGDVDHLVVTPDAFHVVDYKTNDTSDRSVDELAEDYWPQLRAYAVALHQSDPEREVHLTLFFTDADERRTMSYGPVEVAELERLVSVELERLVVEPTGV